MDFTLTPDQELLRETARSLLAKECPPAILRAHLDDPSAADPLWGHLRGFSALGTGDATDLCLFLDETGGAAAPGPFLATAGLFAPLVAALDHPVVATVEAGEARGTVALADRPGTWTPHHEPVKCFVLEADRVDHLAVVDPGAEGGAVVRLVGAPPPGALRLLETVDSTRRLFEVDTAALAGESFDLPAGALGAMVDRWTVAVAAEHLGTTRHIFTMALEYAKTREQFDRPIGSFQAIQHKLAEMALLLERATAAVQYAAMAVDADDPDRTRACHTAKATTGEAARRILKDGAQIHGGIGYTWEHDLHLFLRRAIADEGLLGTTGWHLDRLADLIFAA